MSALTMTSWLVAARIAGLLYIVPGINFRHVPIRIRLALGMMLTATVICVLGETPKQESGVSYETALIHEFVVGLSLGLVPAVMVFGLHQATIAIQGMTALPGGQGASEDFGAAGSPFSGLLQVVVLTIFFLSSGHRRVVRAVLESFAWLPPGHQVSLDSCRELIVDLLQQSFELGCRSILPIAASLALGLLILAAIQRVIPQFGYFAVGMSVQTLVLLGSLTLFLGGVSWFFEHQFHLMADVTEVKWSLWITGR